jgi:hypothetical protein
MGNSRKIADLLDSSGDVKTEYLDNYYTKSQTDGKVVELSPPADLTGYYTNGQVDSIITALKGGASASFDTLGELELQADDNELSVVSNAGAIVASQNAIITNHP